MNLLELSYYLQNKEASKNYLLEKGILKNFTECPYCGSDKLGSIRRDRKKCYKCKKEWHQRKGSFLESRHISYSKFIGFMKLYADDYSLYEVSKELLIEYKSLKTIFKHISTVLFPHFLFKKTEDQLVLYFNRNEIILNFLSMKEAHIYSYLLLDIQRYKEVGGIYSFLINSTWIGREANKFNKIDNFLSFVKMRLISYRGILLEDLYYYLLNLTLRFNIGNEQMYEFILNSLSGLVVEKTSKKS